MKAIEKRIERLETQAGSQDGVHVVIIGLYGRDVPSECEDALVEEARRMNPDAPLVCVELFKDGRCRHCGQLHIASDEEARRYWAERLE